jgi:NAD-dependent SIR2 family protein deacetylase
MAPDGDADLDEATIRGLEVAACAACGGMLKPRVVFFGDNVPKAVVDAAFGAVDAAEVLLVVGTSLAVFSGYRFLRRAVERGVPVVIVNRGPVRGEEHAALKIDAGAGATLAAWEAAL